MSKKRVRLSEAEANYLGMDWRGLDGEGRNKRVVIYNDDITRLKAYRNGVLVENTSESDTKSNEYHNKKKEDPDGRKILMSSWDYELGRNMTIEEYCEKYNLPYEHISSWKAVTHTGTPYYNTVFKTVSEIIEENLTEDYIEKTIAKHVKPVLDVEAVIAPGRFYDPSNIDRLVYTDVHVGLDPNGDRDVALYGRDWKRNQIMESCDRMIAKVIERKTGATLIVDELGDFMDGWDGQTVRKGHKLPQCMTNEEAFDVGLEFKIRLAQGLAPYYDLIMFNNVCEDNHAGAFGYVVNKAFKTFIEAQYPEKIEVFNRREFITHYQIANHLFLLCHGKDSTHLKFGFKPQLDQKQAEKIDQYLKHHGLYKLGCRIEFSKGDSHQCLFDMATSDDFEYYNYPALAPSSDWVQVNFKKGRRGFVIQNLSGTTDEKVTIPIFLT